VKIAVRYQSRGGNTKAVAEVIANSLGVKAEAVDNAITQWVDELEITIGELMHSKLKDNADFLTEKVDEAISNAIDITISNRKLERKTTVLIYIISIVLLVGMSFLNSIPVFGIISIVVMCIYGLAGVGLLIKNLAVRKKKADVDSKIYYAVLLILVALGILLLLLCSSVSVVN